MKIPPQATTEQQSHWDKVFTRSKDFFGQGASAFAGASLELFRSHGVRDLLELGCGQGRDSFLFASSGMDVIALDYSETAVSEIRKRAAETGASDQIHALTHDLREPLPFTDASFDACYSHMLLCMDLSTEAIAFILRETHRVLRPGGLAVYSVRSHFDKHYRAGIHRGEEIYEIGGFVVHFFSEGKIRQLAKGYEILEIDRMEEGRQPRDLFCVAMKKGAVPESWELDPCEEGDILIAGRALPEPAPGRT
jgi:SAM-dependent methyltransferase